jgi:Ser/Thr protein kinase RdoA (MazF antagonist)
MPAAAGIRMTWVDLPKRVRSGVEEILGAPVAEASSQAGGFSPGTADRIRTGGGHRAFVKAVSSAQNEQTVGLHRREAKVAAQLPANPRIPAFLGSYDDGEWVALVLEDIDGRHPATPWLEHELHSVLTSLTVLASELTPSPVRDLPTAKEILADDFAGWTRVLADPPPDLDPWAHRNIHQLLDLADRGLDVLGGDTLVHTDTRADNLLIRPDGAIAVLDWPWACVGAAWLDILILLVNVDLYGGHDVDTLLTRYVHTAVNPDDITATLAGVAGYFVDVSRQLAPRGLPTLRAFQRAHAASTLAWVRRRLNRT